MRVALTFPPAPFLSHAVGEEGGDERSRGDPALASVNDTMSSDHPAPAVRERGRGEGGPHLPPSPLPLSHGEWQGEGGTGANEC